MLKKLVFSALLLGVGGYACYFIFLQKKSSKIDVDYSEKIESGQWIAFSPQMEKFVAFFPVSPKKVKKEIAISEGTTHIEYNEYQCSTTEGGNYSISCIALPNVLLKWGSTSILNGAFKLLLKSLNQKVEIMGKQSSLFKAFPALDYEHYTQESGTSGMLVLVDKILYKIEVSYPLNDRTKRLDELKKFIDLFELA